MSQKFKLIHQTATQAQTAVRKGTPKVAQAWKPQVEAQDEWEEDYEVENQSGFSKEDLKAKVLQYMREGLAIQNQRHLVYMSYHGVKIGLKDKEFWHFVANQAN